MNGLATKVKLMPNPGPTGLYSFGCVILPGEDGGDIAVLNAGVRKVLGYGLVHDIKRPLDLEALRADYRAHKIELGNGATIERYVPAKQLYTFMVPVLISRTLADPFKPARAIQFYVRVKAEDVNMAAHLAGSIVRHKWATPRHSVNISINGTISY